MFKRWLSRVAGCNDPMIRYLEVRYNFPAGGGGVDEFARPVCGHTRR